MVALARSVNAQIIFVTPASNLKDCSPFKSEHTPGLDTSAQQRSAQLLTRAMESILHEKWNEALTLLETAVVFDPRHAELQYRLGQTLLALGRFEEAETALRLARDEDVCPLRALSPMRQVVTEIAEEQGVGLVDYVELLEKRMRQEKGFPIPGEELFLDHVHPTIEGHKLLAVALLQTMIDEGLVQPRLGWEEQVVSSVAAKIEKKVNKETQGQALANLARLLLWAGKTEDAARLAQQALDLAGEYRQIALDSISTLTSVYQRQGKPEHALEQLYSTLAKAPGAIELRFKLGEALLNPKFMQLEEAAANFLLVCQQMPDFAVAHQRFGEAMAKRDRPLVAYPYLIKALRLNPKNTRARNILDQIRPLLAGQSVEQRLPKILLDIYPFIAPRKIVQIDIDAKGRNVTDGIEVEFHENGRIKRFLDIEQGLPNGFEIIWDPQGKILSRVAYQQGKPVNSGSGQ
jgi:tetratricopeptide (TPR) repeat protein